MPGKPVSISELLFDVQAIGPQGTLVLYGSYGTGKTHLLAAIANAVASRGQTCRFASTTLLTLPL